MKPAPRVTTKVPPLEQGDHLTVKEFERRYEAMPHLKKAELIEGVVYMPSPVSIERHGTPHTALMTWLGNYWAQTPGVQPGDNSTIKLGEGANRPQPDALLRILREFGGRTKTDENGYVVGAPELVAEIAASNVSFDLHEKLGAYERNGVKEYIVWRVQDEEIDWFVLTRGKYRSLPRTKDGLYRSKVFPGLWLDLQALVRQDMVRVLQVVQEGIASAEHQQFVARLREKGAGS